MTALTNCCTRERVLYDGSFGEEKGTCVEEITVSDSMVRPPQQALRMNNEIWFVHKTIAVRSGNNITNYKDFYGRGREQFCAVIV